MISDLHPVAQVALIVGIFVVLGLLIYGIYVKD